MKTMTTTGKRAGKFLVVQITVSGGKVQKTLKGSYKSFVAAGQAILAMSNRLGSIFLRDGNTGKRYCYNEVVEQFSLAN